MFLRASAGSATRPFGLSGHGGLPTEYNTLMHIQHGLIAPSAAFRARWLPPSLAGPPYLSPMPRALNLEPMICRSCGNEERASEGYPCVDCGTFICIICDMRGITRCRVCQTKREPVANKVRSRPSVDGRPRDAGTRSPLYTARVRAAVAPMHAEPQIRSEQVSQQVAGHLVDVLAQEDAWVHARGVDDYLGWMHTPGF